jgi:hypothetical protein
MPTPEAAPEPQLQNAVNLRAQNAPNAAIENEDNDADPANQLLAEIEQYSATNQDAEQEEE